MLIFSEHIVVVVHLLVYHISIIVTYPQGRGVIVSDSLVVRTVEILANLF